MGVGVGGQIAGNQVVNALGGGAAGAASSAPAWASGAAGMGAGMGISMAGNYLANKKKPKEVMPTYGGRHADITDIYGRRFEGAGPGVEGGAIRGASMGANPALAAATGGISVGVGALAGAIAGGATKNDVHAFSDFSANDAYDAIGKAYQKYLGREASPDEIMGRLVGQGYDPKRHEYVGERGLYSQLDFIADSDEAKQYAARQAGQAPASEPTASYRSDSAPNPNGPLAQNPNTGVNGGNPGGPPVLPNTQSSQGNQDEIARIREQMGLGGPAAGPPGLQDSQQAQTQAPGLGQYRLEGFDQGKLDSGHSSPKYLIGRTLSQFDPAAGLTPDALAALNKLGIGTFSGKGDKLHVDGGVADFNGMSDFDVARDYTGEGGRVGSGAWQFEGEGGGNGGDVNQMTFGGPMQFQGPQSPQGNSYSDAIMRYLMQQMGLDRAATQIGG
jgi:hypothetical protein